jgi:PTS system galactitol-specific IIC component
LAARNFLIGLDPALLLGHTSVSASLIFIPLTILIAVVVPGNQVLPFGDLATIGFFVAMAVAVHQGTCSALISGVIIMGITLWIATQTIGLHTQLAANAGALKAGGMVASMDQGGSPITWLLIQLFTWQNVVGFAVIGIIYLTGVLLTWRRAQLHRGGKSRKSAAPQQSTGMSDLRSGRSPNLIAGECYEISGNPC